MSNLADDCLAMLAELEKELRHQDPMVVPQLGTYEVVHGLAKSVVVLNVGDDLVEWRRLTQTQVRRSTFAHFFQELHAHHSSPIKFCPRGEQAYPYHLPEQWITPVHAGIPSAK